MVELVSDQQKVIVKKKLLNIVHALHTKSWNCKNMHGNMKETTHSVFAPCPYFGNLMGDELKARYLVIIPKVVASSFQRFLEISSPLILNIMTVGTTSDNVSSKRKTLDEVSLSSSKLET